MKVVAENMPKELLPNGVESKYARAEENDEQQVAEVKRLRLENLLQRLEIYYQHLSNDGTTNGPEESWVSR